MKEIELIRQVGEWSLKNFGETGGKDYGIAEEIGEAIHCVLKRNQNIRGFNDKAVFDVHFADALGDCIIYLADWCYARNAIFSFIRNGVNIDGKANERLIINSLLQTTASMLSHNDVIYGDEIEQGLSGAYNVLAQRICTGCEYWAHFYDLDLTLIVSSTWESVRERDWKKHSSTGVV